MSVYVFATTTMKARHTVSKNELGDTGKVHSDSTEEVVITVQADETGGCHGTSQATKGEDGGCVWDQEAKKTEQCRVTYSSR
jgi:hypothetical protein